MNVTSKLQPTANHNNENTFVIAPTKISKSIKVVTNRPLNLIKNYIIYDPISGVDTTKLHLSVNVCDVHSMISTSFDSHLLE
jgi:hypothetical protein